MKTKGKVFFAVFIAMASAASAQQVTSRQQAVVRAGGEVRAEKQGVKAGTSVQAEHSAEKSVSVPGDVKAASKSGVKTEQSASVDTRPVLKEVKSGVESVKGEISAVKEAGADAVSQAAAGAESSVNAAVQVKQEASAAVGSVGGELRSATEAGALLESNSKGGQVPQQVSGVLDGGVEMVQKPIAEANGLVNGSLKGTAPVKINTAGNVSNVMKINVSPVRAQVKSITAGRISIL
ncbi:hypothetical protein [Chitinophaga deserti]|uniref:hypothetical protein n=1 Tax=Chitinophaga deserti TaxID=2164099 RepID=UPI000D6B2243|nr:hypothetical protein [Chitinophaga deserti]